MPNHVHVLIAFKTSETSINTVIGNGKRFMAYEIVKRLELAGERNLLADLAKREEAGRKARRKLHDVWELSFDWKHCTTENFMRQKLDYYHMNQCKGKWQLAASPTEYEHSSAKFYCTGSQGVYPVTNYLEVADMNLAIG